MGEFRDPVISGLTPAEQGELVKRLEAKGFTFEAEGFEPSDRWKFVHVREPESDHPIDTFDRPTPVARIDTGTGQVYNIHTELEPLSGYHGIVEKACAELRS